MKGHWYCSFCNDVMHNVPAPALDEEGDAERCPVCHNTSLTFVKHVTSLRGKVSAIRAQELFAKLKGGAE